MSVGLVVSRITPKNLGGGMGAEPGKNQYNFGVGCGLMSKSRIILFLFL